MNKWYAGIIPFPNKTDNCILTSIHDKDILFLDILTIKIAYDFRF